MVPVAVLGEAFLAQCGELPLLSEAQVVEEERRRWRNLRGRPLEGQERQPKLSEELFFGEGVLYQIPEKDAPQLEETQPFSLSVGSQFDQFIGSKEILYAFHRELSPSLSLSLPEATPLLLTQMIPAKLTRFRLGVERFRPRFLGSVVGSPPVVYYRFSCEVSEERVWFRSELEGARGVEAPLLSKLADALDLTGLYHGLEGEVLAALP